MSKLAKNILYNSLGQTFLLVLGFVAVKFIYSQLGRDALGILYFTAMMNAIFCAVLEMGLCATSVREISAHFESERTYIVDLIRTFSLFFWIAYALLALGVYMLAPAAVHGWITLDTMDTATASTVLRVLGIAALTALPTSFYTSLFRGLQRMAVNNLIDVITTGLQQLGTVAILTFHGNLFHVVYWFATCYGLRLAAYIYVSARCFTPQALLPGYSAAVVRRVYPFASRMMSVSIVATLHMQIDKLIVSKLLPVGLFGYYSFAYSSVSKGTLVAGAISQAAFPSFAELHQSGDRQKLMSQYWKVQNFACTVLAPVYAAIPFAVLPLFSYLFNGETAQMLLLPSAFLSLGFYMNGTLTVSSVLSQAVGRPGIIVRLNGYALLVVLPAAVLLVYFFGLPGAGFSWVWYQLFAYAYAVPRICAECLRCASREWFVQVLRVFVPAFCTYGAGWLFLDFFASHTTLWSACTYLGSSALYLGASRCLLRGGLRENPPCRQNGFWRKAILGG